MAEYYDELETRDPETREAALMAALPDALAHARAGAPGFADILKGIEPGDVTSRAALAGLPVTRKSDLIELQQAAPPFGGLTATSPRDMARLFMSPGPIADPEGGGKDWWRFARALFAAGFRERDIVHNCFAYHFTPAGSMFETAAHALGCAVVAGGTGQTEMQVQAIAHFGADGFAGTPDFLKIVLDKANEMGTPLPTLTKACVSGGALFPSWRDEIHAHGVNVLQCYGTADLGLIAYESEAMDGMILDEELIVEILRPGTGDPVPEGEVGEVVVTTLNSSRHQPLRAHRAANQGLDGPRRPDHEGPGHVRASGADRPGRQTAPGSAAGPARGGQQGRQGFGYRRVRIGCQRRLFGGTGRTEYSGRMQIAGNRANCGTGHNCQRREGHRRHQKLCVILG
jgi:phenylacetate-coenzyme A ligase PaaK-like adenylate-forming protein